MPPPDLIFHPSFFLPQGMLDEFRIWNYARSWDDIVRDMNFALTGKEPGLLVYYNFDEEGADENPGAITQATDRSGNGNHLIFGGCVKCKSDNVSECDPTVFPKVPCYYLQSQGPTVDAARRPTLVKSAATVGGHVPKVVLEASAEVPLSLSNVSPNDQEVEFILLEVPPGGDLTDSQGNLLNAAAGDVIPSNIVFVPAPGGGGNPYTTIRYTVRSGGLVSAFNMSYPISIFCPPGTYTDQALRRCVNCHAGTFSDVASLSPTCQTCPINYSQRLEGQTNCTACPPNYLQNGSTPHSCRPCSEYDFDPAFGCLTPVKDRSSSFAQPSSIILLVIAIILIVACALVLVVFFLNRETPVVKSASPVFCYLILLGLMIGAANVFFFVGTPTDAICMARPWMAAMALALVLGNLFIKTWRIHRIFGETNFSGRMSLIGNKALLLFSALVMLIELIIPIVWTAVKPLRSVTISQEPNWEYTECVSEDESFSWTMIGIFAALNASILVYGAFLAFKTRKVSSAFRESKFIALCIYNLLLTSLLVLPLVYIQEVGYFTSFFLRSIGTLFSVAFTLVALFGPKLYIIFFQKEKNTAAHFHTFKAGGKKLSSFSAQDSNVNNNLGSQMGGSTMNMTEVESDNLNATVLMKDDSDKLSSIFSRNRWVPKHIFLFKHEKCFGWKTDGSSRGDNGLFTLKTCTVTAFDNQTDFEMEVLFDSDSSIRMKFATKEEFDQWVNAFKNLCKLRVLHTKGSSQGTEKGSGGKGTVRGGKGQHSQKGDLTPKAGSLHEAASHLEIDLQEVN